MVASESGFFVLLPLSSIATATCKECGHRARLSLTRLRDHLGASLPIIDIRLRLACERCSARDPTICFLTPEHRTGAPLQFFARRYR
jgi:hypothetical protein